MKLHIRWGLGLALCLAVSGLAGLGDIPSPIYDTAEPSSGMDIFFGTGIAFENCGGVDLVEVDELGYVDRSHFLSLGAGLAGRMTVYSDASLEGKAFLAGPGSGCSLNWKQVLWRGESGSLALRPGFTFSSGEKKVYDDTYYWIIAGWYHREYLHGRTTLWELPLIYSTGIQVDSQNSALAPTLNLNARLAYAQYRVKWIIKETGRPTETRELGRNAVFMGSLSGNARFNLGRMTVTNELGVIFLPQADNPKAKTVFVWGLSLGFSSPAKLIK